ncbi:MAG: hypothetical protein Q4D05_01030 [Acinetobacter sp.]|nr:hypothetical protein [Acinetobacter sp.]
MTIEQAIHEIVHASYYERIQAIEQIAQSLKHDSLVQDNDDDLIAIVKQRLAHPEPSFKVNLDEI